MLCSLYSVGIQAYRSGLCSYLSSNKKRASRTVGLRFCDSDLSTHSTKARQFSIETICKSKLIFKVIVLVNPMWF